MGDGLRWRWLRLSWRLRRVEDRRAIVLRELPQRLDRGAQAPDLAQFLLEQLADPDAGVRCGAVRLLARIKEPRAVEHLLPMLSRAQGGELREVIAALGELNDARCIGPLLSIEGLGDRELEESVVVALGRIRTPDAVARIIPFLNQDSTSQYADLLDASDCRALESLRATPFAQWHTGGHFARLSGDSQRVLLEHAATFAKLTPMFGAPAATDQAMRNAARSAGLNVNARLTERRARRAEVRLVAARALAIQGDPSVVPPLVAALKDPDSRVRTAAAAALGTLGDARAVRPLIERLAVMPGADALAKAPATNLEEFVEAAKALGKLSDRRATPTLIAAAGCPNGWVADTVIEVLGELADPRATARLVELHDNNDDHRRWRVGNALRKIGARHATPLLIARLSDTRSATRRHAVQALALGDPAAIPFLVRALGDRDTSVRRAAAQALGRADAGNDAVRALIAALGDDDRHVRGDAAESLGKIGGPRAIEPPGRAQAAARGSGDVVPALIAALTDEDPRVRGNAAESLGKIGDPRAAEPLRRALADSDWQVCRSAARGVADVSAAWGMAALLGRYEQILATRNAGPAPQVGVTLSELARNMARLLEKVLGQTTDAVLVGLAALEDRNVLVGDCVTEDISFLGVRQLARQELLRRGRPA